MQLVCSITRKLTHESQGTLLNKYPEVSTWTWRVTMPCSLMSLVKAQIWQSGDESPLDGYGNCMLSPHPLCTQCSRVQPCATAVKTLRSICLFWAWLPIAFQQNGSHKRFVCNRPLKIAALEKKTAFSSLSPALVPAANGDFPLLLDDLPMVKACCSTSL